MAQRVLAVLGAVAMVLVAVVVRAAIDDDGDDGGTGDPSGDGELVLVCSPDLVDACEALPGARVVEQDAATTAAAIVAGDALPAGADGWMTSSAWVEVLEARAPERVGQVRAVASSPVVVAVDPARTAAVAALCSTGVLWGCLGDHAGTEWGTLAGGDPRWGALKIGLPSADTATGLAVVAAATVGRFDGTDFAANDFDPAGLRAWLGRLSAPSGPGERDPVATLVTTRGKYTAVGDLRAAVAGRRVELLEPEPVVVATAVLVVLPGGDAAGDLSPIREALVASGWEAVDETPPPTLKPGVMAALHTLWTEVTR